jgi:hypothetical protein
MIIQPPSKNKNFYQFTLYVPLKAPNVTGAAFKIVKIFRGLAKILFGASTGCFWPIPAAAWPG